MIPCARALALARPWTVMVAGDGEGERMRFDYYYHILVTHREPDWNQISCILTTVRLDVCVCLKAAYFSSQIVAERERVKGMEEKYVC